MKDSGPVSIDLGAVLRSKLGKRSRWLPRALVRMLERAICQDEMNSLLRRAWPRRGADFCRFVLEDLDIGVELRGRENLPSDPRAIFACNHPLGGLDGIIIIAVLSEIYGPGMRFVVNDLLMAVEPLAEVFVPVNTHGAQSRSGARSLDEAMAGDGPVAVFPAGLCSRRGDDGTVADLPWHKMFVAKALEYGRTVVPMFFDGRNSDFFYRMARLRKRSGLRFNIEMVRLPREVFRARGSRFTLTFGKPILPEALRDNAPAAEARRIQSLVYTLQSQKA